MRFLVTFLLFSGLSYSGFAEIPPVQLRNVALDKFRYAYTEHIVSKKHESFLIYDRNSGKARAVQLGDSLDDFKVIFYSLKDNSLLLKRSDGQSLSLPFDQYPAKAKVPLITSDGHRTLFVREGDDFQINGSYFRVTEYKEGKSAILLDIASGNRILLKIDGQAQQDAAANP